MKKLVLIRHGESIRNKENRFTGRTDVDLSEKGVEEAIKAGQLLKAEGFQFKKAFTSYLKRANKTLNTVLDQMNLDWIPVEKSRRLNEKHYGMLSLQPHLRKMILALLSKIFVIKEFQKQIYHLQNHLKTVLLVSCLIENRISYRHYKQKMKFLLQPMEIASEGLLK